jgi:uncharacterized protein (TIGR00304 family)
MFRLFVALIIIGFLLVFGATLILATTQTTAPSTSVGGVVLIGPLPIVFGYGKLGPQLSELAVILTIIAVAFFVATLLMGINRGRQQ